MHKKIEWVNDLRGLAIILVLIEHFICMFLFAPNVIIAYSHVSAYTVSHLVPTLLLKINWGSIGVGLFFLVSGYVIALSLDNKTLWKFLFGRFLRIYPLYWISFIICILIIKFNTLILHTYFSITFKEFIIHNLVGLRDILQGKSIDGIIWTLEIEIKFYLVIGTLYQLIKNNLVRFIISITFLSILLTYYSSQHPESYILTDLAMQLSYIVFMLIGTIFYFRDRQCKSLLNKKIFIIMVLLLLIGFRIAYSYNLWLKPLGTHIFNAYIVCLLIFICSYYFKFTKNRVLSFFADISYPLYLIHAMLGYSCLFYFTNIFKLNYEVSLIITLGIVIGLSILLHKVIELPLMNITKRIKF